MIALIDGLPLVKFENGSVFAFRREWLQAQLAKAAAEAGYRDWWLADHVAQSVTNYLLAEYDSNVLLATELRRSVGEVLATIGYAEVAQHFTPTRPPREISLVEIAAASGSHELTFFARLREALAVESSEGAVQVTLIHLAPAVKTLLSVKLFTEDCAILRDEIVDFARCYLASQGNINILIR